MTPKYPPLLSPAQSDAKAHHYAKQCRINLNTVLLKDMEGPLKDWLEGKQWDEFPHIDVVRTTFESPTPPPPSWYQGYRKNPGRGKTIAFFSGGLDSCVMARMLREQLDIAFVHVPDFKSWAHAHNIKHIEVLMPVLALHLGATRYLDGCLMEESPSGHWQYDIAHRKHWASVFGLSYYAPLASMTKAEAMKYADSHWINYSSCDHSGTWCGSCWNCYMDSELCKSLRLNPSVVVNEKVAAKFEAEVQETARTGIDPFYGDNHIILNTRKNYEL